MFRNELHRLSYLSLVMIGLVASANCAIGQELKWRFAQGDQYEVSLTQSSDSNTDVDSRKTTTKNSTTLVMDWKITAVSAEGEGTIEQSIRSIKLHVGDPAVPSQAITYDTDAPDQATKRSRKLMAQVMPLIGLKFNVVMTSLGEIKSVSLPQPSQDVINQLPGTLRLRALFSENGLKEILGTSVIVLPQKELQQGEGWTEDAIVPTAFGEFQRTRSFTFEGMQTKNGRELAGLKLNVSMGPVGSGAEKSVDGSSLKGSLQDYSGSGLLSFDIAGGYFASSNIQNRAETHKPYREKTIKTVVTNQIDMTIRKK